jgi:hypothetical protein
MINTHSEENFEAREDRSYYEFIQEIDSFDDTFANGLRAAIEFFGTYKDLAVVYVEDDDITLLYGKKRNE